MRRAGSLRLPARQEKADAARPLAVSTLYSAARRRQLQVKPTLPRQGLGERLAPPGALAALAVLRLAHPLASKRQAHGPSPVGERARPVEVRRELGEIRNVRAARHDVGGELVAGVSSAPELRELAAAHADRPS